MNTQPVTGTDHPAVDVFIREDFSLRDVTKIPLSMKFYNDDMECVGVIHFGDAITFEGDAKATTEVYRKAYGPKHISTEAPTTAD